MPTSSGRFHAAQLAAATANMDPAMAAFEAANPGVMHNGPKPVIAVVGATGVQGGSVVSTLMRTGQWTVRALSRDPRSDRARELAGKGVDVIKCDIDLREDLEAAFDGADAVFAMTNFWDVITLARGDINFEYRQGKLMADVAKAKGVKHFIWSSLPNVHEISHGTLTCIPSTNKARVEAYVRSINLPSTFVYIGMYMASLQSQFAPKRLADGSYEWSTPIRGDVPIPLADPENDLGVLVYELLAQEPTGKRVPLFSDHLTLNDVAAAFCDVTGLRATYRHAPLTDEAREAAKERNPVQCSLHGMLDFINEYGYYGGMDKDDKDGLWCPVPLEWTSYTDFLRKSTLRLES
ncbi:hypothetical protein AMAG_07499 [Allomyces macrogynus ATCC 38327]|uniref:NmrA-like domain-containing protein n=1 Tax=Allomyces macrogynus (strain ATCC 38327) TaxID=578462 RepID=A0A0L0SIC7_ALLM3|nr:hypothetical protein AMAG_07499 [Allomyces macrogynus ATCC 38327]|eukprot:KNE62263.1 hypothetical protein AMAG_07499 [Allomyces macrogynus ATCC 38327]